MMATVTEHEISVAELQQDIVSVVENANEGYSASIVTDADGTEKVVIFPPASYVTSEGLEIRIDADYITLRCISDEDGFSGRLERGHGAFSIASFAALILDGEESDALLELTLMAAFYHRLRNFAQTRFNRSMAK